MKMNKYLKRAIVGVALLTSVTISGTSGCDSQEDIIARMPEPVSVECQYESLNRLEYLVGMVRGYYAPSLRKLINSRD